MNLSESLPPWLQPGTFLFNGLIFVGIIALIALVEWAFRRIFLPKIDDTTQRYRVRKTISFFGYALVILLAILIFAKQQSYLTLSIGFISAGIAFALQEVILSFAGWISIFSTRAFKPGDRISMQNVKGDVIDVGILKTTLMEIGEWVSSDNYTGRIVQISNSSVFKVPVFNYSTDFPFVWDEISLPVRFGSDIEEMQSILSRVIHDQLMEYSQFAAKEWKGLVHRYLIEDAKVDPIVFTELTDNWIQFTLRYVVDYKRRKGTKTNLFLAIHRHVHATNGRVQLGSATYEIVGMPDLSISNKSSENKS
ncbi:MAG: mechanosensitive ion channel [Saprospiraceae bacterium]